MDFARYLDQAAEGFFGFMLGPRSEEIPAKAFIEAEHDLSYRNVPQLRLLRMKKDLTSL